MPTTNLYLLSTMPSSECRKIVVHTPGGHDRLKLESHPMPSPAPHEVRVDVAAIGVNFADTIVRMGLYESAKEYVGWPITPGFEVSGVVGAVGDGVDDLAVGDEVFAVTRFGGYASHVVVDRKYVYRKPRHLSHEQAAALPAVYMTGWYALCELAHPRRGQKLLVHSAAGGVGGQLVQIGKILGCEVVGVVGSSHKVASVRENGADHVIDKSRENLWVTAERVAPEGYDVVADANGVSTLRESYGHLRRAGKLVVYGFHSMMPKSGGRPNWPKLAIDFLRTPRFSPLAMTNDSKSVMAFNLSYLFDRLDLLTEAMTQLSTWLAEGKLHAPPVKTYPFADVARAHADLESGQTIGKLVLLP
ncbi:Alcohol dehydrogenase [Labilithrix luteola]|uniref:Alcohol dehydrogenase n=1 Tax=Labilithrix luteola TaxID=1391654 RepID=A0A0K1PV70_9BACT|nr:medium chain dehydrogenase/reductase family protein [Labilithrix luteola]AKU97427.1 Alcohol dehydrogenase [Labilithrix luteola]